MNYQNTDQTVKEGGHLLANLLHFGRLLRQLNIPISSQQIYGLAEGLFEIDLSSREDFYNTSRAFLLHDVSKLRQFDLVFDIFWSKYIKMMFQFPGSGRKIIRQDAIQKEADPFSIKIDARILDSKDIYQNNYNKPAPSEMQIKPIYSSHEILRSKDFGDFSDEEFRKAKSIIREMVWLFDQKRSRRKMVALKKTKFLDFRRSIRNNLRFGGELVDLEWRRHKYKTRPLIVLCDISGSMESYSRIFLYFLYAMVQDTRHIETFVFGTRLTRLTSLFRKKGTDQVFENLSTLIMDWSGGTRIGESIKDFNYLWSRRVASQGSIVMIISDGWDRGNYGLLDQEVSRLSRTAHRLIWLNPLAGSPEYQPLVQGIQTVLPYVDDFYPINNLNNLESLAIKLGSLG
ncbi:MAG: VWA domain-containing protein [Anaerolineaceae bacterium]|nr:VWA domain-containing protein [Anaerolineaceae bacterium]